MLSSYLLVELFWLVSGTAPRREVKPRFYDNVLGDLEPDLRTVDATIKGLPFTVTTNSQGFRGTRPVSPEKPDGTLRILCLGDSYAYGVGVNDALTFPALLENALQSAHPGVKVEAVNAAVPFYDIFDELDYYRDKGRRLRPDLVIVQFFANDLEAMAGLFFRETNKKKLGGTYSRLERTTRMEEISGLLRQLDPGFFAGGSGLPGPPAKPSPYARFHIEATPGEKALLNDRAALLDEKNADRLGRFWTNYKAALLLLRDAVAADGARFLFLILPDPRQVLEYRNAPSRELVPFLRKEGIPFLDFGQLFRKYAKNDGSEFFLLPYNEHLSELGNTLAARIVSDAITVSGNERGEPVAGVDVKERFFGFASPVSVRMDITGDGVRQASGREEIPVSVVSVRGLGVVRERFPEGDVFSLAAADPEDAKGGEIILKAKAPWPIGRLDVICFRRIFHPAGGGVRISWSLDGERFTPASVYVNQPDKTPDGLENIHIDVIPFGENAQRTAYLKIELSGLARVFTQERDDPLRRLELVFYPAEHAPPPQGRSQQ